LYVSISERILCYLQLNRNGLNQLCTAEMPCWAKIDVTIFVRAAHCMTHFHFSKPKFSLKLLEAFEY